MSLTVSEAIAAQTLVGAFLDTRAEALAELTHDASVTVDQLRDAVQTLAGAAHRRLTAGPTATEVMAHPVWAHAEAVGWDAAAAAIERAAAETQP